MSVGLGAARAAINGQPYGLWDVSIDAIAGAFGGGVSAALLRRCIAPAEEGRELVERTAKDIRAWVGDDARLIRNDAGDTILISKEGTRRVRFDVNRPYPHQSPHAHVEELVNGEWRKSGPIYPADVPQR